MHHKDAIDEKTRLNNYLKKTYNKIISTPYYRNDEDRIKSQRKERSVKLSIANVINEVRYYYKHYHYLNMITHEYHYRMNVL